MSDKKETIVKMMTKRDFNSVDAKFKSIEDNARKVIESANELDVLVLEMQEGSAYEIKKADIINESSRDKFVDLMRTGTVGQSNI